MYRSMLLALSLLIAAQCEALLPPLWASVREIEGILKHPDLGKYLDAGQTIHSIERVEGGFRITTNRSKIKVDVLPRHYHYAGPAHYDYVFHLLNDHE